MHSSGVVIAAPLRSSRSLLAVIGLAFALVVTGAIAAAAPVRASEPAPLKAVVIVGPTGSLTSDDLVDAESIAVLAESYGMDVRRVYLPTRDLGGVMANIQGANSRLLRRPRLWLAEPVHGQMTESRQNGLGPQHLRRQQRPISTPITAPTCCGQIGCSPRTHRLPQPRLLHRRQRRAGHGRQPTWDVARQRVDNIAAGFLDVGARAVFAYSYQKFNKTLQLLFTTDQTVEQIFRDTGLGAQAVLGLGWLGPAQVRLRAHSRAPELLMDPQPPIGFHRAITGDLKMTGADWALGSGGGEPPTISQFKVAGGSCAAPDAVLHSQR